MKLLLFSDLHCDVAAAERLVAVAQEQEVDVLIGAGDFGTMRRGIETTLRVLRQVEVPALLVAGNAESPEELAEACLDWPQASVLHGTQHTIDGVSFFGLGGAVPVTPFGSWSYDLSEQQATELLADCPPQSVLVSHSPPHGAVDVSSRGVHLGSQALRETILRTHPRLVVCGHIHDSAGKTEQIDSTPVHNAGPSGRVWELSE